MLLHLAYLVLLGAVQLNGQGVVPPVVHTVQMTSKGAYGGALILTAHIPKSVLETKEFFLKHSYAQRSIAKAEVWDDPHTYLHLRVSRLLFFFIYCQSSCVNLNIYVCSSNLLGGTLYICANHLHDANHRGITCHTHLS